MTYKITDSKKLKTQLEDTFKKINDYSQVLMQADEEKKEAFTEYNVRLSLIEKKYNYNETEKKMHELQDIIPEIEWKKYLEFYMHLFNILRFYEEKGIDVSSFLENSLEKDFDLLLVTEPELSRIRVCEDGIYTSGPVEDEDGESWDDCDDDLDFVMVWNKDFSSNELESILFDLDMKLRYIYIAGLTQNFIIKHNDTGVQNEVKDILASVDIALKDALSTAELRYPGGFVSRKLPSGNCALERQNSSQGILIFNPEMDIDEVQEVVEQKLDNLQKKIEEDAQYVQYLALKAKYEK